MSEADLEWSPRWYLWEGGFLALGRSRGVVPPHAHHAIQIVIGLDGEPSFAGAEGRWRSGPGLIVRPDVVHAFNGDGVVGAMLFVDPECAEGRWLLRSVAEDLTVVPAQRVGAVVTELRAFHERPQEAMEFGPLVRHTVQSLCVGPPPLRQIDERVLQVLDAVRTEPIPRLSLEKAAAMVFLSPSRFAHLFTEHVGLPFRRYLLWRKLTRAIVHKGHGLTLTEAAHAGGFADSAHLTRTFYQMFGIPPSLMLRGELIPTDSPFAPR